MPLDSENSSVTIYLSFEKLQLLRSNGEMEHLIGRIAELGASLEVTERNSAILKITANQGYLSEEVIKEIKYFITTDNLTSFFN